MTWYVAFVVMRLLVAVFFFMTSAYSILNYTPFVFYHFLRPRLFAWVNEFVASHHLWYCAAYLVSVVTLLPDLKRPETGDRMALLRRRLAFGYVVVFGLVGEWLVVTPYLPKLWNDDRSLAAALLSFAPLVWLAVVDHVATRPGALLSEHPRRLTDQRRVLVACLVTAEYLWVLHLTRAILHGGVATGVLGWVVMACWTQALNLTAVMVAYAVLNGVTAIAGWTRVPRLWEYALVVALAAFAISTVFLEIIFPNLAFGEYAPMAMAIVGGVALATTWSGVAVRRPHRAGTEAMSGIDLFVAPVVPIGASWLCVVALMALPIATFGALGGVARTDWNFILQKVIVAAEWVLGFGLIFGVARRVGRGAWSPVRAVVPPVLALVLLMSTAWMSARFPVWTGTPQVEAEVALDRYAAIDLSFKLLYDGLVQHPGRDAHFVRYLQRNTSVPLAAPLVAPEARFSPGLASTPAVHPHVFLFVVDSLRRDYLSPFNPKVTFTPNIAAFASENFAFQNAFSRYGGTFLAVPSIWAGGLVIHRTAMPSFERTNALEKLFDVDDYRWYMSVDTHIGPLLSPRPDLVELDRGRNVMQFDLCRTLGELTEKLAGRTETRPIFAFNLPQNLHISQRQHAPVPAGEHYEGFFEPYAAEVHRLDKCFGEFVSYLKRTRLFDDSVIILTTDHGDSLGEDGNWGHSVTLYPEVVRIPLIIHIPERLKPHVTTDLGRVTFSTDIVPTLYELLGHSPRDLGPLFGSPLFVAQNLEPVPRRRQSFLLASSYAATYALIRRNGRLLYIADLVNGREYAYDSTAGPLDTRIPVTDDLRHVSQRQIREQLAALADLYHFVPAP